MKPCQYYAFNDANTPGNINACSISSEEYPLTVNCTGNTVMTFPFTTDNVSGRDDFYFILIERGRMDICLPNGRHTVGAGDIIIFPPHYRYKYTYGGGEELSYLWVHFTGSYAERFLGICGLAPLPFVCRVSSDPKITSCFHGMFEIFERSSPMQRHELACRLEQLLLYTAEALREGGSDRKLERSLNFIHFSYNKEIRIPELARMELLSNSRYIALFKKRTGLSPSEYIIKLRMNVACDLLRNTDMSVKQISLSAGYSDPHFFSKLFKKKTGVSPQKYRET